MRSKGIVPYLYLLPALALVSIFLLIPMAYTLFISFTKWDGLTPPRFVGFSNYLRFIRDHVFFTSLINTFIWVILTLALPVALGLFIAVGISRIRAANIFKSILYIPLTLSAVTTGIIWTLIYSPELGVVNTTLRSIGLGFLTRSWLTEVPLNTYAMIASWSWKMTGLNMAIFLMGLTTLPTEPIEAAKLEGASGWQTFAYVIFPMLRPTTTIVVAMSLINSFNVFDIIYVMTDGGPYRSSETLAVTMYRESFVLFRMGYGAAIAIFLSILVLIVSGTYIKEMLKRGIKY